MFKLSENIDPNKIFIVNRSELEGRIDPEMILYSMKNVDNFKYPYIQLKKMLLKSPQYGANEASVIRINNEQPRYIRITDIDENGTLRKELGATADTIDSKYILNNNDILFARSGATVGKTYIHKVKKNNYKAFFAGYMIRFIVNPDIIIPDFVFIYTQLSVYKKWVKATQRAAGQPNINAEEYKSLKIPLPPLEIQQQIVDLYEKAYTEKQQKEAEAQRLLDSIDDYLLGELGITLPKEEEYLLQNTDKNTSYNLDNDNPLVKKGRLFLANLSEVTGKRIDPYFYKESFKKAFSLIEKSQYPICKLKDISEKITSGITPLSGGDSYTNIREGIPFIRSGNIDINGNLNFEELLYLKPEIHNTIMKSSQLKKNDLIVAIVGATIGRVGIYLDNIEANINQAIALIRLKQEINPEYMKELINSSIGQLNLNRLKRPVARANINLEELATVVIVVPPLEKQNEIATYISQIRSKANILMEQGEECLEKGKQEVEQMILGN